MRLVTSSSAHTPAAERALREELVRLPGATIASRIPSLRSKGSHRGSMLSTLQSRAIVYESKLEADVAFALMARGDVVEIIDQPPPVFYIDRDGTARQTTFDFLIVLKDGRRIFIAIKPAERALKRDFQGLMEHIAAQISRKVASHVLVVDERDLFRDALKDARLFHAVRRDPPSPADAVVKRLIAGINAAVEVEALVKASGLGAMAFRAVARLVADGLLTKVGSKPLSRTSLITAVAHGKAV